MNTKNELLQNIPEVSFQKLKLLSGEVIGIRKWLMKEEKEFLFSIETQDNNKTLLVDECLTLSKKCVDDPALFDTLSKNDLSYLISKQRALSKGEEITFSYHCINPKCTDFEEFDEKTQEKTGRRGLGRSDLEAIINLKSDTKITSFNSEPIVIGNYTFHVRDVPYKNIRLLEEQYLGKTPELFKLNNDFMVNSIVSVEIGEKKIEHPTHKEINELLDTFTHDQYMELSDKIGDNISGFAIEKNVSCPLCGDENPIMYEEIFSLLVF